MSSVDTCGELSQPRRVHEDATDVILFQQRGNETAGELSRLSLRDVSLDVDEVRASVGRDYHLRLRWICCEYAVSPGWVIAGTPVNLLVAIVRVE